MRTMRAALVLALILGGPASAQTNTAARHPLEGVWSRVAGVTGGQVVTNQPGFRMFVDGHWSTIRVEGLTPRPAAPATGATADQLRAAFQPFTAQGGTYQIQSAQTYVESIDVAYNPAAMGPGARVVQLYRVRGDTLWTSNILGPAGPAANPQTGMYLRARHGGGTPLDGAWRMVEGRSPDGTLRENQPGYRLFVDGHYTLLRVNGTAPRPALPPVATATAEQLTAVWAPFTAQQGTFEISGQTITEHPLVTKAPGGMAPGNFVTRRFRIAGDSLWMTQTGSQAGPVAAEGTTFKYVRVRGPRPPTN